MNSLPRHPFRFGVNNANFADSADLIARARLVEDLGYDVFHLTDHTYNFAPITGMAAAAQATSKLRIGSNVLANDFWHPAILARELLAIDCLSNGRLDFGLGSGYSDQDYTQTGIPMDTPGVRISRLEESIQIIRGLLSGETVTFHGKYYNITELNLPTKPVQQPHPPILIGGGGRRVLTLAARLADIVGFNFRSTPTKIVEHTSMTLEATQQKVDWVCQAAGDRLPDLEFNVFVVSAIVTNSQKESIQSEIEDWSWNAIFTQEQVLESPHFLIGDVEQIVDKLIQNRERFGFSYYVVRNIALESFAPVVKRLAGK